MAIFSYRAFNDSGKRVRGSITAASGRHARDQLRTRGLIVEVVRERSVQAEGAGSKLHSGPPPRSFYARRRSRYRTMLTTTVRELATLLQAGVPLLEALDSVVAQSKGGFHTALLSLRDRVCGGSSLAEAMAMEPGVFDEMTIGMVRVGEHAGNLDEVLEQVAEFREKSGQVRDRVLSAILYPAIIFMVTVAVTGFLMTVVVPMLLQNLLEVGRPLPLPTRILKWMSDMLVQHSMMMGVAGALFCFVVWLIGRTDYGRSKFDQIVISIPVLGTLIKKQAISRMALVVSCLLRSGVQLVDALAIAERSSTNRLLKLTLAEMQHDLRSGRDLKEAALRHRIFPIGLAQVFSLGQQSGQLDKMLARIGHDYDRQAGLMANRLTTVLEPLLILVLSVIVGFILFATVLPILEAGNVLAG